MYGLVTPRAWQGADDKGHDGDGPPYDAVRSLLTLYSPDGQWPKHAKAYWNDVLDQARAAGWTLNYLGASHTFGYVKCPAGEHTFKVDSTARDAETWAKNAVKSIRNCSHGTPQQAGSKVAERIRAATALLDSADRLADRAQNSLTRLERSTHAQAELERLDLLVASASHTIDDATELQEQALREAVEAEEAAPEPADVDQALSDVSTRVTDAAATLKNVRKHPGLTKPLQTRIAALRARLQSLTDRLAEFTLGE
jgi:hypothetical protein